MPFSRILALFAALAITALAKADTLFNVSGTGSQFNLSGTLTIDTTTDLVTAANINADNGTAFTFFTSGPLSSTCNDPAGFSCNLTNAFGPQTRTGLRDGSNYLFITFIDPLSTAISYAGGPLGVTTLNIGFGDCGYSCGYLIRGSITAAPTAAVTPEPSSLVLLGTGTVGIIISRRRLIRT